MIDIAFAVFVGFLLGNFAGFLWFLYELRRVHPDLYAELRKREFSDEED